MPADVDFDDNDLEETEHDTDLVRDLRRKLRSAGKKVRDYDTLAEQNKTLAEQNRSFQMTGLLSSAGLSDLDDVQKETLAEWAVKQDTVDADALRARAVALRWAEPEPDPADEEIERQERIANANRGGGGSGKEISARDFASWDQARKRAFIKAHPQQFEALKRGESVRANAS